MSDWWTYSLSDFLLFSPRTYYRLFELYNAAVWPGQVVVLGLGVLALWLVWRGGAHTGRHAGRLVVTVLAACWLWVAWAYFFERYATINWAAEYFAASFVLQALLLCWTGLVRDRLTFVPRFEWPAHAGIALIVCGLLLHPLITPLSGRPWMQAEIFGLAPDPTVLVTLGVLLGASRPHRHLVVIPLLWCAISGATLWTMQAPEALLLPVLGAVAFGFTVRKAVPPAASPCSPSKIEAR